ncbi:MED6-domain-containing protein [Xylariomycetidae sp. FL0641]|nr:MED6-domain-containing protein [Xylariomycetidae sp. FL0641]
MATQPVPIDEIGWRDERALAQLQGVHSNSVLFYFAASSFFDITSNNAILFSQANFNDSMRHLIFTREAFEGRLRQMSGLEFMVAQEPAEMGPGAGTGIWVIRKQTRRKREPEDDITVHATYYIMNDVIFMAPSFAQLMGHRLTHVSFLLSKCFPAADSAQSWTPGSGHFYKAMPSSKTNGRGRALASQGATPLPEGQADGAKTATEPNKAGTGSTSDAAQQQRDARLAETSFMRHMRFGGEYMDENPINGKPGRFLLSSTGRNNKALQLPSVLNTTFKPSPAAATSTVGQGAKKEGGPKSAGGAGDKTPKTPTGTSRTKRKKSKTGQTPTSS